LFRDDSVVEGLREAAKQAGRPEYAFDAVSKKGSYVNICDVLQRERGHIALLLPGNDYSEIPSTIRNSLTRCWIVLQTLDDDPTGKKLGTKIRNKQFGTVMFRLFRGGWPAGGSKGSLKRLCRTASMGLTAL